MAITFNNKKIWEYDYEPKNNQIYHVEIRQGNCAGVHIWIDKENNAHLFNFLADKEHAKNMRKHKADMFKDCKNITLNIADEGTKLHMEQAIKFGHSVKVYYNKEELK